MVIRRAIDHLCDIFDTVYTWLRWVFYAACWAWCCLTTSVTVMGLNALISLDYLCACARENQSIINPCTVQRLETLFCPFEGECDFISLVLDLLPVQSLPCPWHAGKGCCPLQQHKASSVENQLRYIIYHNWRALLISRAIVCSQSNVWEKTCLQMFSQYA